MSLSLLAILLFDPFRTFMIGSGLFSSFPPDRRIWEPPAMPPQQRTILLVDDDHEILESMRMVLESKGFRILAARDGNAGLMIAERENPDLLILDMMMPKKSGFLVLEKLRSRPGGLIPTIMITGNEGSRHRAYAEMLGVRDYIRKPFAMEKLIRAVERIMGIKSRSGEGDDDT
jgi:DNA-binding response OmpR family regulator